MIAALLRGGMLPVAYTYPQEYAFDKRLAPQKDVSYASAFLS